ncbi:hypothetical protein L1887_27288 [Cichorium endivia]|nr:hypothetical protein L1887_27288 [Cichorium endivia]
MNSFCWYGMWGKAEEHRKSEAAALHIGAGGGACFRSGVVAAAGNYGGRKRSRWSEVAVYNLNLPHSSVTSDFEASIFPHHGKRKRTHHSYCSSSIMSLKDPSGLCGVVTVLQKNFDMEVGMNITVADE